MKYDSWQQFYLIYLPLKFTGLWVEATHLSVRDLGTLKQITVLSFWGSSSAGPWPILYPKLKCSELSALEYMETGYLKCYSIHCFNILCSTAAMALFLIEAWTTSYLHFRRSVDTFILNNWGQTENKLPILDTTWIPIGTLTIFLTQYMKQCALRLYSKLLDWLLQTSSGSFALKRYNFVNSIICNFISNML